MGTTALVSGTAERLFAVGDALKQTGFEVLQADDQMGIAKLCTGLGPEALDCYIQLPTIGGVGDGTLLEQTGEFLTRGLLARFKMAAAVVPLLRTSATVVLVAGHEPPPELPDDRRARHDLLTVLARAVAGVTAPLGVRTVVAGSDCSPTAIANLARTRGQSAQGNPATRPTVTAEGSYDDWRRDMISLATPKLSMWLDEPGPDDYDW